MRCRAHPRWSSHCGLMPVATLVMETPAFGINLPLLSTTVPVIVPPATWA